MVFDWVDAILVAGLMQGGFLIFSLQRIQDRNVELNRALVMLLSITSFMLFGRLIFFQVPPGTFVGLALVFDVVIFLFGPVTYYFTRQMLFSDTAAQMRWKIHLIPAAIHLLIAFSLLIAGHEYFVKLVRAGYIRPYYLVTEILGITSNLAYIVLCFVGVSRYRKEEKNQLSFEQSPQRFIQVFISSWLGLIVVWMLTVINYQLRFKPLWFMNYDIIWSVLPLFTYVVGYYMQRQPALFRLQKDESPRQIPQQRLGESQIAQMKSSLDRLMSETKIYLNNDLTLPLLADEMGEKPNDISWLLNVTYQSTFYDFINQHRVQALLDKLARHEHARHTLLGLAFDCGFNSKSTFNKAFKKHTGKTPSEYIQDMDAQALDNKMSA